MTSTPPTIGGRRVQIDMEAPLDMAPGDGSAAPGDARQARTPCLLDTLLPVVVMIMLIALTIASVDA